MPRALVGQTSSPVLSTVDGRSRAEPSAEAITFLANEKVRPMTRFSAAPFALILFGILTIQARAADPDVKLQEVPRPSSVQIVFANLPKANYSPTILPDLYLPIPRANAAATVIIPR